jgi:hypothetical protein
MFEGAGYKLSADEYLAMADAAEGSIERKTLDTFRNIVKRIVVPNKAFKSSRDRAFFKQLVQRIKKVAMAMTEDLAMAAHERGGNVQYLRMPWGEETVEVRFSTVERARDFWRNISEADRNRAKNGLGIAMSFAVQSEAQSLAEEVMGDFDEMVQMASGGRMFQAADKRLTEAADLKDIRSKVGIPEHETDLVREWPASDKKAAQVVLRLRKGDDWEPKPEHYRFMSPDTVAAIKTIRKHGQRAIFRITSAREQGYGDRAVLMLSGWIRRVRRGNAELFGTEKTLKEDSSLNLVEMASGGRMFQAANKRLHEAKRQLPPPVAAALEAARSLRSHAGGGRGSSMWGKLPKTVMADIIAWLKKAVPAKAKAPSLGIGERPDYHGWGVPMMGTASKSFPWGKVEHTRTGDEWSVSSKGEFSIKGVGHLSVDETFRSANFVPSSRVHEDSPLEGPVGGFNRHQKLMSPDTREMVLRSREQEIMEFARDRSLNPTIVMGICEAAMRLGRVPNLQLYGIVGDEAKAIKDFVAHSVLNLSEDIAKTRLAEAVPAAFEKPQYADDFVAGFEKGQAALKKNPSVSSVDAEKAYRRVSKRHGSWWVDGYEAAIGAARGAYATKGVRLAREMGLTEDDAPAKLTWLARQLGFKKAKIRRGNDGVMVVTTRGQDHAIGKTEREGRKNLTHLAKVGLAEEAKGDEAKARAALKDAFGWPSGAKLVGVYGPPKYRIAMMQHGRKFYAVEVDGPNPQVWEGSRKSVAKRIKQDSGVKVEGLIVGAAVLREDIVVVPRLTQIEKIVLAATFSWKAKHMGLDRRQAFNNEMEFATRGEDDEYLTQKVWDEAKASLIKRGLLNKRGALTKQGKPIARALPSADSLPFLITQGKRI